MSAEPEAERRTTYLELFFDLVFVFAITQVTTLLLGDMTVAGFARSALVLAMVWWAWSAYAWMTNAIDVGSPVVRAGLLVAAAGTFFMAIALPDAFGVGGIRFAAPYFAVRTLNILLYVRGLRHDREHQASVQALAPFFLLAPAIVLAGGFVGDPSRVSLWGIALAIDLLGALNAGRFVYRVSPSHFAERYALFVIIALGESVVAIGVAAAHLELDVRLAGAVAVSFAGVAALWWAYFDFTAGAAERILGRADATARGKLARGTSSPSATTRSSRGSSSTPSRRSRPSRTLPSPSAAQRASPWGRGSPSSCSASSWRAIARFAGSRGSASAQEQRSCSSRSSWTASRAPHSWRSPSGSSWSR